jgi:beta-glucanase (GH16 family)
MAASDTLRALSLLAACAAASHSGRADDTAKPAPTPPPGYSLVWSDDFNYEGLPDPAKWDYEEGFVRNHESQYYTRARLENARVENHQLIIEGRKEEYKNAHYTSAALITKGKESWTYGRIEVRAKLPHGKGQWPAIWMLGTSGGWPAGGEIDIMEFVGKEPDFVHATIHYRKDGKHASNGKQLKVDQPWNDFHVYAVEWTPDRLDFYYDQTKYQSVPVSVADDQGQNPFRKAQYLLINLAMGGSWGGPIDDSLLPQKFVIDYVRVYQKTAPPAG